MSTTIQSTTMYTAQTPEGLTVYIEPNGSVWSAPIDDSKRVQMGMLCHSLSLCRPGYGALSLITPGPYANQGWDKRYRLSINGVTPLTQLVDSSR